MARNLSVQQFQDLMKRIPQAAAEELTGAVNAAGDDLVNHMKPAVPTGVDGRNELLESVRKAPGKHPLQVRVMAGGELTTRAIGGGSYDYANAVEFGTEKMHAQPFFWPTYRLRKRAIVSTLARRARKAIEKVVPLK